MDYNTATPNLSATENLTRLHSIIGDMPWPLSQQVGEMVAWQEEKIAVLPGSRSIHHTQPGGWLQHTLEVFDIAMDIAKQPRFQGWFEPKDIFLAALLHDFAKLHAYENTPDGFQKVENAWRYMSPEAWTLREVGHHGIYLSNRLVNALLMAEGGWSEFARSSTHSNRDGGDSTSLAALIHAADLLSATVLG